MPYATIASHCGNDNAAQKEIEFFLKEKYNFAFIEFREIDKHGAHDSSIVSQVLDLQSGSEKIWKTIETIQCCNKSSKTKIRIASFL